MCGPVPCQAKLTVNTMFSRSLSMFACCLALSQQAMAQDVESIQDQAIVSVGELLILDAATAANVERQRYLASTGKQHAPAPAAAPVATPVMAPVSGATTPAAKVDPEEPAKPEAPAQDQLDLLGILGFGQLLRADITINGHPLRFQAGQAAPINGPTEAGYKLISIKAPCAVLANDQGSKTVCINRSPARDDQ